MTTPSITPKPCASPRGRFLQRTRFTEGHRDAVTVCFCAPLPNGNGHLTLPMSRREIDSGRVLDPSKSRREVSWLLARVETRRSSQSEAIPTAPQLVGRVSESDAPHEGATRTAAQNAAVFLGISMLLADKSKLPRSSSWPLHPRQADDRLANHRMMRKSRPRRLSSPCSSTSPESSRPVSTYTEPVVPPSSRRAWQGRRHGSRRQCPSTQSPTAHSLPVTRDCMLWRSLRQSWPSASPLPPRARLFMEGCTFEPNRSP